MNIAEVLETKSPPIWWNCGAQVAVPKVCTEVNVTIFNDVNSTRRVVVKFHCTRWPEMTRAKKKIVMEKVVKLQSVLKEQNGPPLLHCLLCFTDK